ncbi:MAG: hypothetical protein ACOY30_02080 [Bacillota bacterium]
MCFYEIQVKWAPGSIIEYILELKEKPVAAEEILAKTCGKYGINISNPGQQCLMDLTIMA